MVTRRRSRSQPPCVRFRLRPVLSWRVPIQQRLDPRGLPFSSATWRSFVHPLQLFRAASDLDRQWRCRRHASSDGPPAAALAIALLMTRPGWIWGLVNTAEIRGHNFCMALKRRGRSVDETRCVQIAGKRLPNGGHSMLEVFRRSCQLHIQGSCSRWGNFVVRANILLSDAW
jgi:hypothetical protein